MKDSTTLTDAMNNARIAIRDLAFQFYQPTEYEVAHKELLDAWENFTINFYLRMESALVVPLKLFTKFLIWITKRISPNADS